MDSYIIKNEIQGVYRKGHTTNLDVIKSSYMVMNNNGYSNYFVNENGMTLLHLACKFDVVDMVPYLLNDKNTTLSIEHKDHNGNTALNLLCAQKKLNYKVIQMVLNAGADVNTQNMYNETPLHWACAVQSIKLIKLLCQYNPDFSLCTINDLNPLHLAAYYNYPNIVKQLLTNGSNVNSVNGMQNTALHFACMSNAIETIIVLLKNNTIDIEYTDNYKRTALHFACLQNSFAATNILLQYKANIEVYDIYDESPLSYAMITENFDIVKLLLIHGAEIDFYHESVQSFYTLPKLWKTSNETINDADSNSTQHIDIEQEQETMIKFRTFLGYYLIKRNLLDFSIIRNMPVYEMYSELFEEILKMLHIEIFHICDHHYVRHHVLDNEWDTFTYYSFLNASIDEMISLFSRYPQLNKRISTVIYSDAIQIEFPNYYDIIQRKCEIVQNSILTDKFTMQLYLFIRKIMQFYYKKKVILENACHYNNDPTENINDVDVINCNKDDDVDDNDNVDNTDDDDHQVLSNFGCNIDNVITKIMNYLDVQDLENFLIAFDCNF